MSIDARLFFLATDQSTFKFLYCNVIGNYAYHNFEDTKTIKLLINLNKIQKLYNIVKSNTFYFS